jgi:hypothetical protein
MDELTWRRADHGDPPAIDSVISAVVYPADSKASVIIYAKMRVVAVNNGSVYGPNLPSTRLFELPGRPDDIIGKRAFFWRPYGEE